MKAEYVNPFLEAVINILGEFGIEGIKRGNIFKKDRFYVSMDITSVIGLIGDIRGNISYSLSQETAKNIVSAMMMGMHIEQMDDMARSAIGELANMITGKAAVLLEKKGVDVDITAPSVIFGKDIYMIISLVEAICVELNTPFGIMEVGIGLEI